eukprot:m.192965 g.192965  ORF g.192965 m.192965 type:complete len:95 (+) comp16776_c4_seq2:183-467(+)
MSPSNPLLGSSAEEQQAVAQWCAWAESMWPSKEDSTQKKKQELHDLNAAIGNNVFVVNNKKTLADFALWQSVSAIFVSQPWPLSALFCSESLRR